MDNYRPKNSNMSEYYNDQGGSSTSARVPYLTNVNTGNNSTRSLGEVTAVGTPRVNPTENADDVNSLNLQHDAYNRQNQEQTLYGQSKYSTDEEEKSSSRSRSGSFTKRDSTTVLASTQHLPLIGQNTYDLGNIGNQHYYDYNQSNGYYSQYNKHHRQDDPYYDEEATRHNTLTSGDPYNYPYENDYTDRDFPGSGKGARQSMTGEHLTMPIKKKKRGCCNCCSWPICLLITLIVLTGLGVTGFFVLPRVPKVDIKDAIPVSQPNISTDPPFIDMNFTMVVEIDNNKNYISYKFNKIDVSVFDRNADNTDPIATGSKLGYTLQPKRVDTIDFPLNVNYKAANQNDPVLQDFVSACSPDVKDHTKLKLRVDVVLFVWGIDWIYKPKISVPIPDIDCPVPKL